MQYCALKMLLRVGLPAVALLFAAQISASANRAFGTEQPIPQDGMTEARWPLPATVHQAVIEIPASAEASIESVARYIAGRETDPFLRVKALHDYVVVRLSYDESAFLSGRQPPQDAQTAFKTRRALCGGYAQLLSALGRAIGEEIIYISGEVRTLTGGPADSAHAWNAAKIRGAWYLIDPTWDSGAFVDGRYEHQYSTDYLFTPASTFGLDHLPKDPSWQLRSTPLTQIAFLEQPLLTPQFRIEGLQLVSARQTAEQAAIEVANPTRRFLIAKVIHGEQAESCAVELAPLTRIRCPLAGPGTHQVRLFSARQKVGFYPWVGQLQFAVP